MWAIRRFVSVLANKQFNSLIRKVIYVNALILEAADESQINKMLWVVSEPSENVCIKPEHIHYRTCNNESEAGLLEHKYLQLTI